MNKYLLPVGPRGVARTARLGLCLTLLGHLPASSQTAFTVSDLPSVAGEFTMAYVTSNANPSLLIGNAGASQVWDFSQAAQPGDIVRRMDIVPPNDGGNQANFPGAAYAERYTDELVGGAQSWDYYSIATNAGRNFFGFYDDGSATVFVNSVIDIPSVLNYGSNWNYTVSIPSEFLQISVSASVDAYGKVILPQIGSFQALRVNQLTTDQAVLGTEPLGPPTYFREFFWLVPGIGKAVHIVSNYGPTPPPANFSSAWEVRRVFAGSAVPSPVSGLGIKLAKGKAILNWMTASNASAYQVQAAGGVAMTNWQILATPTTNFWSEFLTPTQRFYRVLIEQ